MIKYIKISLFVLIVIVALTVFITPAFLVFIFPPDAGKNQAFTITLAYMIFLVQAAVFTPLGVGLVFWLRKNLLPNEDKKEVYSPVQEEDAPEEVAPEEVNEVKDKEETEEKENNNEDIAD